jgi:hypothetical protein
MSERDKYLALAFERFPDTGDDDNRRWMGAVRYGFLSGALEVLKSVSGECEETVCQAAPQSPASSAAGSEVSAGSPAARALNSGRDER